MTRRLGDFSRSAHSNIQGAQKIFPFFSRRAAVSIVNTLFRSHTSSASFHNDSLCGGCPSSDELPETSSVLRRWVTSERAADSIITRSREDARFAGQARVCCEFEKVLPGSLSDNNIGSGDCVAKFRKNKKLDTSVRDLLSGMISARNYLKTLGRMASCIKIIPNARLYMGLIQLHFLHF